MWGEEGGVEGEGGGKERKKGDEGGRERERRKGGRGIKRWTEESELE